MGYAIAVCVCVFVCVRACVCVCAGGSGTDRQGRALTEGSDQTQNQDGGELQKHYLDPSCFKVSNLIGQLEGHKSLILLSLRASNLLT